MSKKILYFDTETTGLNPILQDIIQIAGIIVIDGQVKEEFNIKCQPFSWENIEQKSIDTHGMTIEMMREYQPPQQAYKELVGIFSKYISKYDTTDKFTPAGYNVGFDCDMLKEFFAKNGDVYYGSWCNWKSIDPLKILHFMDFAGKISLPNYKLTTVCEHFGIEIDAHDALSDIRATRDVVTRVYKEFIKE